MRTTDPNFELLDTAWQDVLGEGPWWSASSQRLWWVDILGRRVHRSDIDGRDQASWTTDEDVGFAIPCDDGRVVLGVRSGLAWLDPGDGHLVPGPRVDAQRGDHRINDGKTDRRGRLWFGTMHDLESDPTSAFYRCDDRGVARVLNGITTSNGLGWSPDNRTLYYTDSMTRSIVAYSYDLDDGVLTGGRTFTTDPKAYVPDGLTVDTGGCVWGAKWGGGKVVRYTPEGHPDLELRLPVTRPTSCMFVGDDLRTLAVTSAQPAEPDQVSREELAGRVFLIDVAAQGIAEHPAKLPERLPATSPETEEQTP